VAISFSVIYFDPSKKQQQSISRKAASLDQYFSQSRKAASLDQYFSQSRKAAKNLTNR